MPIGQATGFNYALPGGAGQQMPGSAGLVGPSQAEVAAANDVMAPAQGQASLPPINQDIAQVEGITNEYYDSYGKLKSYVEDMNSKGIDVTKPDYTQAGGGMPFQTYKKLEAYVMQTGNTLKQELDYRNKLNPQLMADKVRLVEGVNPSNTLMSTMNPTDVSYSTDLFPEVVNFNTKMKDQIYTQQDLANYNAYRNNLIKELETRKAQATTPQEIAMINNNLKALAEPVKTTQPFKPESASATALRDKNEGIVTMYKQAANVLYGTNPDAVKTSVDENFNLVQEETTLHGTPIDGEQSYRIKGGREVTYPKVIDAIIHKDGKKYIRFVQPEKLTSMGVSPEDAIKGKVIQDEEFTGTAQKLLQRIIKANRSSGVTDAMIATALEKGGLIDQKSKLSMDKSPEVLSTESQFKEAPANVGVKIKNEIIDQLKKSGELFHTGSQFIKVEKVVPTILGVKNVFKDHTYKVYTEWNGGQDVLGEGLTLEQVPEVLRTKTNYFQDKISGGNSPHSGTKVDANKWAKK